MTNFVVNLKFEEFQLDNNEITIMPFRLGVFCFSVSCCLSVWCLSLSCGSGCGISVSFQVVSTSLNNIKRFSRYNCATGWVMDKGSHKGNVVKKGISGISVSKKTTGGIHYGRVSLALLAAKGKLGGQVVCSRLLVLLWFDGNNSTIGKMNQAVGNSSIRKISTSISISRMDTGGSNKGISTKKSLGSKVIGSSDSNVMIVRGNCTIGILDQERVGFSFALLAAPKITGITAIYVWCC